MWRTSTIPVSSCSEPIGRWTATQRSESCSCICAERAEEVGALAVEHVDEEDARDPELLGPLPDARRADLDPHHAAEDDERALDDAQRAAGLALEARVARDVDQVDLAALPLGVRQRERDRHPALLLVVVPVRDRRSPRRSCRAGSSRRPGRAAPRRARSCRCHGGRRRRRCGSFRARMRACERLLLGWLCRDANRIRPAPRDGPVSGVRARR